MLSTHDQWKQTLAKRGELNLHISTKHHRSYLSNSMFRDEKIRRHIYVGLASCKFGLMCQYLKLELVTVSFTFKMCLSSFLSIVFSGLCLFPTLSTSLNITILEPDVPFVPGKLPAPHAASHCDEIVEQFSNLGRTTIFNLTAKIPFQGDTYEPEGIVKLGGDRYFVSAGEYTRPTVSYGNGTIINGTDRANGAGFAHIIVFDGKGNRIADATLTALGAPEYHNGGIDYDGEYIWATIAQYRPNSTATITRIDPKTIDPTPILHRADHLGGIVHDTLFENLVTLNWGSRNATTWDLQETYDLSTFSTPSASARNPSYFVDYQDCKFLGHPEAYQGRPVMICSGVATIATYNLGGLALVDMETMTPLDEVPIPMVSDLGTPITQNPMDVSIVDGRLTFYFLPDQHNSTLYVYQALAQSPYEF